MKLSSLMLRCFIWSHLLPNLLPFVTAKFARFIKLCSVEEVDLVGNDFASSVNWEKLHSAHCYTCRSAELG